MSEALTEEQQTIIHHPLGSHARVLAIAGSGKTTTMVHRVQHLVEELHQDPARVRVLMFNRLAREEFERKLAKQVPDLNRRPKVLTFHALAFGLRMDAEKQGLFPHSMKLWTGDLEELALWCMNRAIDSLVQEGAIPDLIDPKVALDTVGLWKASLIPPERAGHRTNPDLPLVYRRFEELRVREQALTFDDFIPEAFKIMDSHPEFRRRWTDRLDHLIVDEYQDVNYGQQQLIRLLAGNKADVMVVGDDDQTIYEWRAARPRYILEEFKRDFTNKAVADYPLSHSFRFGPLVAQTAYNVITTNEVRAPKSLVAHEVEKQTDVKLLMEESEQASQVDLAMASEVEILVRKGRVAPTQIAVLGRSFIQFEGLQAVFLQHKIPFRVLGQAAFFERDENRTLIDYFRLAFAYSKAPRALKPWRAAPAAEEMEDSAQSRSYGSYGRRTQADSPSAEGVRTVLAVANTPSRRLLRSALRSAIEKGDQAGQSLERIFARLLSPDESPFPSDRREAVQELDDLFRRIGERSSAGKWQAGEALDWLMETVDYERHYTHLYGSGVASVERIASLHNFVRFARDTGLAITNFIDYLSTLQPSQGKPNEQLITMTSIHRTKGLEYDYVFIPNCVEGYMPMHAYDDCGIYDTKGIVPESPASPPIESERRLFYVGLTRAKKQVYIGTHLPPTGGMQGASSVPLPSRFLEEMQLEPSRALVGTIQQAVGRSKPEDAWRTAITKTGIRRELAEKVIKHYGGLLSSEIRTWVCRIKDSLPDEPFRYSQAYPDLTRTQGPASTQEVSPDEWEDPWAGLGTTL